MDKLEEQSYWVPDHVREYLKGLGVVDGLNQGRQLSSILLAMLPSVFSEAVGCALLYVLATVVNRAMSSTT